MISNDRVILQERTKNAQFIVISLRTNMFELANMLTGIYKTYNCTKTVTIRPDDFCRKSVSFEVFIRVVRRLVSRRNIIEIRFRISVVWE